MTNPVLLAATLLLSGPFSDSPLAPGASADDRVLRVYDLRDVGAVLPALRKPQPPLGQPYWLFRDEGAPSPFVPTPGGGKPATPIDSLVSQLCNPLNLMGEPIADGVYLVAGERAGHEQFAQLVESVRAVYTPRCDIEVLAVVVPEDKAPAVGTPYTPAQPPAPLRRIAASVPRRVPTTLESTETRAYIGDWTPVVADHSVGYDPQTAGIRSGLSLEVCPGAEGPQGTSVRITGSLCESTLTFGTLPLITGEPNSAISIGLPASSVRDITSAITMPSATPTVAAVVTGFKPDEAILIVVSVK